MNQMIQNQMPPNQAPAKTSATETRSARRTPRRWVVLAGSLAMSLVVCAVLVWLLLPGLRAVLTQQMSSGSQTFEIGAIAQVTPEAGWVVQRPADDELRLISPDRGLTVTLMAHSEARAEAMRDASDAASAPHREETLANGSQVMYIDTESGITGELMLGGRSLFFAAACEPSAAKGAAVSQDRVPATPRDCDVYRATVAELLLQIS